MSIPQFYGHFTGQSVHWAVTLLGRPLYWAVTLLGSHSIGQSLLLGSHSIGQSLYWAVTPLGSHSIKWLLPLAQSALLGQSLYWAVTLLGSGQSLAIGQSLYWTDFVALGQWLLLWRCHSVPQALYLLTLLRSYIHWLVTVGQYSPLGSYSIGQSPPRTVTQNLQQSISLGSHSIPQ